MNTQTKRDLITSGGVLGGLGALQFRLARIPARNIRTGKAKITNLRRSFRGSNARAKLARPGVRRTVKRIIRDEIRPNVRILKFARGAGIASLAAGAGFLGAAAYKHRRK